MAAGASDAEVLALLKRYKCPTPFHEVRTRFLGSIASPVALRLLRLLRLLHALHNKYATSFRVLS